MTDELGTAAYAEIELARLAVTDWDAFMDWAKARLQDPDGFVKYLGAEYGWLFDDA